MLKILKNRNPRQVIHIGLRSMTASMAPTNLPYSNVISSKGVSVKGMQKSFNACRKPRSMLDSFLTENLGTYDMFIQMARRLWCTIRIEEGLN